MNYFFPSFFTSPIIPQAVSELQGFTTNSGENALRLLLRSFHLPEQTPVAIPAFVCDLVPKALIAENLTPVYLDLKNDGTYWSNYNFQKIEEEKCRAVILVHLYGFVHPDTASVVRFCAEKNIRLIHDAAQCYGADDFSSGDGTVYSFGPGKSTTSALGGWITRIDETFYNQNIDTPSLFRYFLADQAARLFFKSRIYGYRFSVSEKIYHRLTAKLNRLFTAHNTICTMTSFQLKAANMAIAELPKANPERKKRHHLLSEAIKNHPYLALAYDDGKGMYFKFMIHVNNKPRNFAAYLKDNSVPYFSLFEQPPVYPTGSLPVFNQYQKNFFEISTEASVPNTEIERIAQLLSSFR